MSEAIKPTPGEWRFYTEPQPNGCPIVGANGLMICMLAHSINYADQAEEALSNARLIAEAGTVHHETGLTPRQLVEQRDALVRALEAMTGFCDEHADFRNGVTDPTGAIDEGNARAAEYFSIARAALALVKGEQK